MREFPRETGQGLQVLANGCKSDQDSEALPLYADAALLVAKLGASESVTYPLTSLPSGVGGQRVCERREAWRA
jgi:hypothetical protein